MEQHEKDFIEKLNKETKDVEVPKDLLPERVSMILKRRKQKKWKVGYTYSIAACIVCVLIGVGVINGMGLFGSENNKNEMANIENPANPANSTNPANTANTENITSPENIEQEEIIEGMRTAKDYKEVVSYLKAENQRNSMNTRNGIGDIFEASAEVSDAMSSGAVPREQSKMEAEVPSAEVEYSETNVRQEGVDEGDIVKTDGKYLYIVNPNRMEMVIIDIQDIKMKEIAYIDLEDEFYMVEEMYLQGKTLTVVGIRYNENDKQRMKVMETCALVYDISNIKNPQKIGEVVQDGSYYSSRMVDGYVYLFSEYYVTYGRELKEEEYIPAVNGDYLDSNRIYIPENKRGSAFFVVTATRTEDVMVTDSKALLMDSGLIYVSNENIYVCEVLYQTKEIYQETEIRKLQYNEGRLRSVASGQIRGYLNDSFSIDEYQGNLRVVTHIRRNYNMYDNPSFLDEVLGRDARREPETGVEAKLDNTNAVYILNEKLEQIGRLEQLAKDEDIYSARFMGEIAYFVTFREIDPLFSVDLKNPERPKLMGELKIPGFSEYLHPYGEGKLLGIGQDGETKSIKLSMFDITDPYNVIETDNHILQSVYRASVVQNYKAVLIDAKKNIIGFSADGNDGSYYYIYSYKEETGFESAFERALFGGYSEMLARGVYVNDILYIISGSVVESFTLQGYEEIDRLML